MKQKLLTLAVVALAFIANNANAQFVDISTGKTVNIVKHQGNGMMYNTETQRPVHIYINPTTNDTFYGRTGEIINGKISRNPNGSGYLYNNDAEYVFSQGEFRLRTEADSAGYKKVFQGDGDVKVKYGDYKRKEDVDGDVKIKEGTAKVKTDTDGTVKVKDSTFKAKRDEDGNILIKDDSTKLKFNADGSAKVKDKRRDYKGKRDENGEIKKKYGRENKKVKVKNDKVKVKTD